MIDFTTPSSRLHHRFLIEGTWELPDHLGTGRFRKIELGNGLWIGLGEVRLKSRLWEEVYDGVPGVTLIFCLKGRFKNRNNCFSNGFELSAGTGVLCFSPDPVVIRQAGPGEILQKAIIKIPLCQIELLLENRQLERAVRDERPFLTDRPLSAGMQAALFQAFYCPFQGSARRLYLEGKALELIAHWLCCGAKVEPSLRPLKPDESERIWRARDLLLQDLRNPPSLMELSKAVGITHTRLNSGFKTIFGHTVFEWFRIQRLEKACMLVMEGQKNMTEIAYEIGFASSSHFTCAFRRFFGTTPSRYR
jgi:AraC-like DNA-binding protein